MEYFHTHGKVEAQVSIRRGVEVGGANSPPALPVKHQRRARLNLSALGPVDGALYVPAEWTTQNVYFKPASFSCCRTRKGVGWICMFAPDAPPEATLP